MPLEVEKTDDEIIIKPIGDFDYSLSGDFRAAYENEKPDMRYTVDMSRVSLIDSTALGMLIKLREHTGGRVDIQIVRSSKVVREIFDVVHFTSMFQIE
ncbi:MAG: STAS domain-containing protein [Magnetococcales bacterium]|nr:STAS domain-containing protein [Magnetococcales bacterium]